MSDVFEKTYCTDKNKLAFHRKLGKILKFFSLGLYDNSRKIKYWEEKFNESEYLLRRKKELKSLAAEYDEYEITLSIDGIRISQYTFTDISVLGPADYPENWHQLRQIILERDSYTCQLADGYCEGPLQIHHIVALSKGGSNNESNLTTLCKYHHYLQHPHLSGQL